MDNFLGYIITALLSFIVTLCLLKVLIPKLKSHKMGQKILDIGPRWHKSKEGTPTMGGISFIAASILAFLIFTVVLLIKNDTEMLWRSVPVMALSFMSGFIGFIDDYTKFIKKQNEGLTAKQKYTLQLVSAGIFMYLLNLTGNLDTTLHIPFIDAELELGWFYMIFAIVLVTGMVNAVNLTDGIDGLASSVTFIVSLFFAAVAFRFGDVSLGFFSAVLAGGTIGFLCYNFYPAKIFMGDTGSLFLGGTVTALAFMIFDPIVILLVGIIYVSEAASVILQVFYFKISHGKRLFKMAPLHHHFEKCGWSEVKIVSVFSAITLLMAVLVFLDIAIFI
ncbi:MAG: phospho-N-acetylmuramoyl-pentapeptide-transferase [Ruminococcaceae bacterium]|nr:phospho-N-acetylmuramoyl-pentapeptide-transferase [Oscillospiraceae bacterium]